MSQSTPPASSNFAQERVKLGGEPPPPAPIVALDEEEAWLLGGPILKKVRCLFAIRDDVRVVLFVTDY